MTKEKSKLKKEADKPDLKPLKRIKKHKSDKPPKSQLPDPEKLTPDSVSDSIQTTKKKKKHKSGETKSLNPKKLTPDSDSVQSLKKKKKKKHKPAKIQSLNHEQSDSVQTTRKKKKHKSDNPEVLNSEEVDSTPEPDSIQILKKKKKKRQKSDKTQSPKPESKSPDIDSIQSKKSDKPQKLHSPEPENFECQIDADSIRTRKKKKQKSDKPHPLKHEVLDSEIDSVSKKKRKQELDKPQSSNPEILDSQFETDSIGTSEKKKQKLDKPYPLNTEILDFEIDPDSIQTPKTKKQKLDECQKPQSVHPEILDSEIDTDSIQNLLEHHSKDQLIEFLLDSAVKTPSIFSKIIETADQDISHRRLFVHNLDWDTTREAVVSVFEQFGELEACDVVYDRATGKTKGFGFVTFKSRKCAKNALKEPKKRIDNRTVSCHLASIGPPVVGSVDNSSRKIYVSNVEKDVDSGKLREFFEKFGEIEVGPLGFDMQTGKSKGYALFVYKNLEGVRKVLEEPNKIFDGKQLNCRMANDWNGRKKNSKSDSSVTTVMMPVPHDLSAVLPKQNMVMVGQQAGLNPMLGQLSLNSIPEGFNANPGAGLLNQLLCQAAEELYANPSAGLLNQLLSQAGIGANQFGQMGVGLGGYGEAMTGEGMGNLAWNQSGLGSSSGSTSAPMLQGWQHAYSDT